MKKTLCLILALLLALAAVHVGEVPPSRAEGERALTLMVYMCGSNLESAYGSASADLREMLDSGYDASQVTVLVMAGGSQSWNAGFDPGQLSISELGRGGMRVVWRDEAQSMGQSDTLNRFLRFGKERYPARDYALILWDHGGGPMEGVCWDELFSMDNLSLSELVDGLSFAHMPKKLSWIGFDACLMCSAEVAGALSPYANYMIASQETEPAAGWNYAFLKGIENDRDGGETGRRAVDAYFQGLEGSNDILTMACLDLSRIGAVEKEMDRFFRPISDALDENVFNRFSDVRLSATGFGKPTRAVGDDGYDLVDLRDLIDRYEGDSTALEAALDAAVVYSRSSESGAGGLSVYHPYSNKKKYSEAWKQDYRRLEFSPGYARYLERFGTLLTEDSGVDWRNLETVDGGVDGDGNHVVTLALTPEQVEDLASAQLMVMERPMNGTALDPISVEPAALSEDGTLTGRYAGRALYAVDDDDGSILCGPVSFLLSDDGEYYLTLVHYYDYSARGDSRNEVYVMYHLAPEAAGGDGLRILRTYVFDEVSGTYTNRLGFDPEGYTHVGFWKLLRKPQEALDPLPGFDEWNNYTGYYEDILDLTQPWHFCFGEERMADRLYATFQLTDARQNLYSSQPVALANPEERVIALTPAVYEDGEMRLTLSAVLNAAKRELALTYALENLSEHRLSCSSSSLRLNDRRGTERYIGCYGLEPGGTETTTLRLDSQDLRDLEEVRSIACVLTLSNTDDRDAPKRDVALNVGLEGAALPEWEEQTPLAEAETGGLVWRLMELSQEREGTLTGLLYVRNDGDSLTDRSWTPVFNDLRLEDAVSVRLDGHTDRYIRFSVDDRSVATDLSLNVSNTDRYYLLGVNDALERAGHSAIHRLALYSTNYDRAYTLDRSVTFELDAPVPLRQVPADDSPRLTLLDDERISVTLESALVADDGVALGLWLENRSEDFLTVKLVCAEMDDKAMPRSVLNDVTLPAHTRAVMCPTWQLKDGLVPGEAVNALRFVFGVGNEYSDPMELRFPAGTALGASGGSFFAAADLEAAPAALVDRPGLIDDAPTVADGAQPIRLTLPLTDEEAAHLADSRAELCLWDGSVYRVVSATGMTLGADGTLCATLSGMALTVNGQMMYLDEGASEDGTTTVFATYQLHFMKEAGTDALPPEEGFDMNAWIDLDMDLSGENPRLVASLVDVYDMTGPWDYSERTAFPLEAAALAVLERDGYAPADGGEAPTEVVKEYVPLPLDDTLALALVPARELEGRLFVRYSLRFDDYTVRRTMVELEEAAGQ